ncbi:MAG: type II toxin-antitoxin system Phd/YefM family antitoxin [Bacilli bacterium]|nr:type II toxin-antitoxin system Phd/YefM family antitoxin [Bacilli bacterium]
MNIRPSADLRNNYKEMSAYVKKTKQPVYITVNGKEDTVLMDAGSLEILLETLDLQKKLLQGIDDIRHGRTCTIEDIEKDLGL